MDKVQDILAMDNIVEYGIKAIALVALVYAVRLILKNKSRWLGWLNGEGKSLKMDERSISVASELIDFIVGIIAVIIALNILGLSAPLYSALTAAGVGGIIIGFAAKDIAANFISGIFILIDRPFVVGDAIEVNDTAGTVIDIAMRITTVVSWDGIKIAIPNNILATNPVINYSTAPRRRVLFNVPLAIDSDVARAQEVIKGVLEKEERVLKDQWTRAWVDSIRDGAIDLQILCYTPIDVIFDAQSDIKRDVIYALRENDIQLAVPLRRVAGGKELIENNELKIQ